MPPQTLERTLSVTYSDPQDRYDGATDVNHTTSYFDRDREWIRHQDHFSVIAVNALCWSPDGKARQLRAHRDRVP